MALQAWDVGIKTLSYCVLGSCKPIAVLDWDRIDLVSEKKIKCCGMTKAGKKCDKIARKCLELEEGIYGFCLTHESQNEKYWNEDKTEALFIDIEGSCEYVSTKGDVCGKKGKKHHMINYCQTHYKARLKTLKKQYSLKKVKKQKAANKVSTKQLIIDLFLKLDKLLPHFRLLQIKHVRIENQPSLVNPKMKALGCALYDYFIIRAFIDKVIDIETIEFVSPSNKIALLEDDGVKAKAMIKAVPKNKRYDLTKKLTVIYVKDKLADQPEQIECMELFAPKLDDPADAFALALYDLRKIMV